MKVYGNLKISFSSVLFQSFFYKGIQSETLTNGCRFYNFLLKIISFEINLSKSSLFLF